MLLLSWEASSSTARRPEFASHTSRIPRSWSSVAAVVHLSSRPPQICVTLAQCSSSSTASLPLAVGCLLPADAHSHLDYSQHFHSQTGETLFNIAKSPIHYIIFILVTKLELMVSHYRIWWQHSRLIASRAKIGATSAAVAAELAGCRQSRGAGNSERARDAPSCLRHHQPRPRAVPVGMTRSRMSQSNGNKIGNDKF